MAGRPRGRPTTVDHTVKVRLTAAQKAQLRAVGGLTGRSDSAVLSDVWNVFWDSINKAGAIK